MKNLLLATSAMAMLGLAACTPSEAPETDASAAPEETAAAPSPTFGTFGIETANIDENTAPGDDFNRYVNGQWLDTFEIPSDRSRYGVFNMLADEAEIQVREIIEDAAASEASIDTLEGKISAFYNAYMDTETINAAGLAPAQPYLDRIAAIETREDLAAIFAATGFRAPIGGYVDVDARNPEAYIFYVGQGGLGLPDRSYYLNDTPNNLEVREAYLGFLTTMLETAGYEDPAAAAQTVYDLEHDMAEAHWDRAIGRNRNLTYNNVTREELIEMGNGFPVEVLLNDMGLGAQETFVVRQVTPTAEEIEEQGLSEEQLALLGDGVSGLLEIANTAPIEAWQAYLTAHFLSGHADVLPKPKMR